jgi:hypothetical protein
LKEVQLGEYVMLLAPPGSDVGWAKLFDDEWEIVTRTAIVCNNGHSKDLV